MTNRSIRLLATEQPPHRTCCGNSDDDGDGGTQKEGQQESKEASSRRRRRRKTWLLLLQARKTVQKAYKKPSLNCPSFSPRKPATKHVKVAQSLVRKTVAGVVVVVSPPSTASSSSSSLPLGTQFHEVQKKIGTTRT